MKKLKNMSLPATIIAGFVIMGVLIGGGIFAGMYFGNANDGAGDMPANQNEDDTAKSDENNAEDAIKSIPEFNADADKYKGNPNADIVIIEYSDFECPFCKRFHETMNKVIENYKEDVVWVYRHFPLEGIHPTARKEAIASECVYDIGGNGEFWKFTDRLFEVTETNSRGDVDSQIADAFNATSVDKKEFYECLDNKKTDGVVAKNIAEASRAGFNATPMSVIMLRSTGERFLLRGAQSYELLASIIDQVLASEEGEE